MVGVGVVPDNGIIVLFLRLNLSFISSDSVLFLSAFSSIYSNFSIVEGLCFANLWLSGIFSE